MLYEFLINFNKESNTVNIVPMDNDGLKNELVDLITSNSESMTKDFEIEIKIDEMNNVIYSRFLDVDHNWEKKYKKLTAGSIFMLIHSMMDHIGAIQWTETVVCHDKNNPKYDMFKK